MENNSATSKALSSNSRAKSSASKESAMPRRFWTTKEEEVLLNLLDALVAEGWKSDGTFNGNYMVRLEREMNEKLPGCGLQVKHIKNKMTVWKKTHSAIKDILAASGAAGFSMDPTLNMLIEEKQDAWNEYAKVHPKAVKDLKGRPQPWHLRWRFIFGNDQAAGTDRVDIPDAPEAVGKKAKSPPVNEKDRTNPSCGDGTNTNYDDDLLSSKDSSHGNGNGKSASSKRRKTITDDPEKINMMIGEWMESTKSQIGEVSKTMMGNASDENSAPGDDSSKRASLYAAIEECTNLDLEDIITVTHHFSHNKPDMDAFWGMPVQARAKFVGMILRGKFI